MSDYDFNSVDLSDAQNKHGVLIPENTLVFTRLKIISGDYFGKDRKEYPDGMPTASYFNEGHSDDDIKSVYLKCQLDVICGPYKHSPVFHLIGLYSRKGPAWGAMGRVFIRQILDSAHGLTPRDDSPMARGKRQIMAYKDLNGLCIPIKVGLENKEGYPEKNKVKKILQVTDSSYREVVDSYENSATVSTDSSADEDIPF